MLRIYLTPRRKAAKFFLCVSAPLREILFMWKRNGRLLRAAFFAFFILWPILLMWKINQFGHVQQAVQADAAIVLGAAVWRERPFLS
jgi:hypothetical protein